MAASNPNFNVDALDALRLIECPICLEVICPPVFQCSNGHLVCSHCLDKITCCPTCRAVMPNPRIRNLVIEDLLAQKCPYSKFGCQVTLNSKNKEEHISRCEYGKPGATALWNIPTAAGLQQTSVPYEQQASYNQSWTPFQQTPVASVPYPQMQPTPFASATQQAACPPYEQQASYNQAWTQPSAPNPYQHILGKYEFVSSDDSEYTPVGYRNKIITYCLNGEEWSRKSLQNADCLEYKFKLGEKFVYFVNSEPTSVIINMVGNKFIHTLEYTESGETFRETVVEEFKGDGMISTYTFEDDVHVSWYNKQR